MKRTGEICLAGSCLFVLLALWASHLPLQAAEKPGAAMATNRVTTNPAPETGKGQVAEHTNSVQELVVSGQYSKALALLEQSKALSPDQREAAVTVFYFTGKTNRLAVLLKKHPDLGKRHGPHQYALALYALTLGRHDRFFRHALLFLDSPSRASRRTLYGIVVAIHKKQYERALSRLESVIDSLQGPEKRLGHRLAAFAAMGLTRYDLAWYHAHKALQDQKKLSPQELDLLFQLALRAKKGSEAVRYGQRLLLARPQLKDNARFRNNLACAWHRSALQEKDLKQRQQDLDAAQTHIKAARALGQTADVLHTAALIAEARGNPDQALSILKLARALRPKDEALLKYQQQLEKKRRKTIK